MRERWEKILGEKNVRERRTEKKKIQTNKKGEKGKERKNDQDRWEHEKHSRMKD